MNIFFPTCWSRLSNFHRLSPFSSTSFHHLSPTKIRPLMFLTTQKSRAARITVTTKIITKLSKKSVERMQKAKAAACHQIYNTKLKLIVCEQDEARKNANLEKHVKEACLWVRIVLPHTHTLHNHKQTNVPYRQRSSPLHFNISQNQLTKLCICVSITYYEYIYIQIYQWMDKNSQI